VDRAYGAGGVAKIAAASGATIAKGRLLGVLRAWSGEARTIRPAQVEPPKRRGIAPLALLLLAAIVVGIGLGYALARQADDYLEAEHRQALSGALDALRAVSPDLARVDPQLIPALERASGLKDLKFETEPSPGERAVQSVLDRKGRIIGWFSWEPERPATEMLNRILPVASLVAVGLAGLAVLLARHLGQLGRRLAKSEQHVQRLEFEDALTALPNHNHFFALLDRAMAKREGNEHVAFATVDLDGFDEVNDALGYAGGDEVFAELGKRLREAITPSTMIARLGSDEFAVMVTGKNAEVAQFVVESVREALVRPIWLNQVVQVGASVGLAVAPRDGVTRDELTRRADLALRTAKRRGRGTVVAFASEMEAEFQEQRFIKREAARTLAARGFDVHYQPIVAADGGAMTGVEALLRWEHPTRGMIPPAQFVPIVEEAGLMDQLGEFVLRRAVSDAARWDGLYVSVNLSPVQVRDRAFIGMVASVLQESDFPAARLVLEMTEGVLIENPEETATRLVELRQAEGRPQLRRGARQIGERRRDHPGHRRARARARHGGGDRRDRDRAAAGAAAAGRLQRDAGLSVRQAGAARRDHAAVGRGEAGAVAVAGSIGCYNEHPGTGVLGRRLTRTHSDRVGALQFHAFAHVPVEKPAATFQGHALVSAQLGYDAVGAVDFRQRLADSASIDRDRAVDGRVEAEIAAQRLDVAVEIQSDHLGVLVDEGRTRVAADGVVGRAKIELPGEVEALLGRDPALGQLERRRAARALVGACQGRERRDMAAVLVIAFHGAVREAQGEGRVGVCRGAVELETCLRDQA
jgi:diguanylate cyclase (GGDEF)-like protein